MLDSPLPLLGEVVENSHAVYGKNGVTFLGFQVCPGLRDSRLEVIVVKVTLVYTGNRENDGLHGVIGRNLPLSNVELDYHRFTVK